MQVKAQPTNRLATTPESVWFSPSNSRLKQIGRYVLLVLLAGYFAFCDASSDPMFLRMDLYTQGTGPTPYQYRELMMYVFRALIHVGAVTRIAQHISAIGSAPYRLIFLLISFISILGAVFATKATIKLLTADRVYAFWASLLIIPMALLLLASTWGPTFAVPYDVPSLAFFALGIYLIAARRWWAYYPMFILAIFNRETACFITVFLAVWEWFRLQDAGVVVRERLTKIAPHVAVQAILWIAIKSYLSQKYAHNLLDPTKGAGGLFAHHVGYNLKELLKPWQWPLLASPCAFSLPLVYLQRRWIRCNPLLFASALTIALSFAGLMIVGVITEVRIFADWIAIVVPCIALIVHNRFQPMPASGLET